jgi:hypothetical protein
VPLLTPAQVEKIINRINEGKKNPIAYDKVFFLQNELTIALDGYNSQLNMVSRDMEYDAARIVLKQISKAMTRALEVLSADVIGAGLLTLLRGNGALLPTEKMPEPLNDIRARLLEIRTACDIGLKAKGCDDVEKVTLYKRRAQSEELKAWLYYRLFEIYKAMGEAVSAGNGSRESPLCRYINEVLPLFGLNEVDPESVKTWVAKWKRHLELIEVHKEDARNKAKIVLKDLENWQWNSD